MHNLILNFNYFIYFNLFILIFNFFYAAIFQVHEAQTGDSSPMYDTYMINFHMRIITCTCLYCTGSSMCGVLSHH